MISVDLAVVVVANQRQPAEVSNIRNDIKFRGTRRVDLNIHSNLFSAGEIRGQLAAVPLPTALPLLITGVAAIALRARRRRT